jgi:hypothetical protein
VLVFREEGCTTMPRALLALAVAVLLSGCATPAPTYRWSSDRGRACVSTCRSQFYQCRAHCGGDYACESDCAKGEWSCAEACPDVKVVFPP